MKNTVLALLATLLWAGPLPAQKAWVRNASLPYQASQGLKDSHVALWASHGRYYDRGKGSWQWQRPPLFCTTEDLFTQTIVVPYLIPMLEDAGAVVFTPRERDWQRYEVIVDNDAKTPSQGSVYTETHYRDAWQDAPGRGFAMHTGAYRDDENPFEAGTARMAETNKNKSRASEVSYQPNIPEAGRYAVYVSYTTVPASIDDAKYTVWHQGQPTEFHVNQQIGGFTWVYLGTFDFDAGSSKRNRVVLTCHSSQKGMVTTDAVRFGGGMGNIARGGKTSGLPRCLEGARYYAQWAGMPYSVYSFSKGTQDYNDDMVARSSMTNLLAGGSRYAPDSVGRKVPIELSLAVHSDAGHTETGLGVYGTLSICTTGYGDAQLASGESRSASKEFASSLLNNMTQDLQFRFGKWKQRRLVDSNYSETRRPIMPSAILETLSHQNFGDMTYGQDPNFRFWMARSIYKTILRYLAARHGEKYVVTPLAPTHLKCEFADNEGKVNISWKATTDEQEKTSNPEGYILYISQDGDGFDNGTVVKGTSCSVKLKAGVVYNFQVRAYNDGGQSFPTEIISAYYNPKARHRALIVNGFHRLSSPAISRNGQGFDLDEDPGVSYGRTAGLLGRQVVFDTERIGIVDSSGLGFSTSELQGQFIAGNDFRQVRTHAEAIAATGRFSFVSASAEAVEEGKMQLKHYAVIDLILGLERNDGHSLVKYKSMDTELQKQLRSYVAAKGCLLVSGAYIGTDMQEPAEKQFLAEVLKVSSPCQYREPKAEVRGMNTTFSFYHRLNDQHYAATSADVLMPAASTSKNNTADAFPAMAYANGMGAAVAYGGQDYHAFTMGFPFECITDAKMRKAIMNGILYYLIPN